ncbi:MAG: GNAT family N-acetyltransferase [Acidobacteriota bacterium]
MLVRSARPSDGEAIATLHALSWRRAYQGILAQEFLDHRADGDRRRLWRERLADPRSDTQLVRVAVTQDRIVGFVCVYLDHDERWGALLDNLHIHPDLTGRGVGRQLMAHAASWVLEHRPRSGLHLWVFEDNLAARGFYERFGGVPIDKALHHAPDGRDVRAVKYVWEDLGGLVRSTLMSGDSVQRP